MIIRVCIRNLLRVITSLWCYALTTPGARISQINLTTDQPARLNTGQDARTNKLTAWLPITDHGLRRRLISTITHIHDHAVIAIHTPGPRVRPKLQQNFDIADQEMIFFLNLKKRC